MAWYDVTLEGFTVHGETWDHILEVDGKRDEVFIHSGVRVVNQAGATLLGSTKRSAVLGDTNGFPYRVRAGSASTRGGLRTGDNFPYDEPWRRQTSLQNNRPPMRLWQGELTNDHAVVITPTIWEWDGGADIFNSWAQSLVTNGPKIVAAVVNIIAATQGSPVGPGDVVRSNLELGLPALYSLVNTIVGQAADRPIGMIKDGSRYRFDPQNITLTDKVAELAIQTDFGRGGGIVELNYADDSTLAGNYSLFIKIAKVNVPLSDGSLVREVSSAPVFVMYGGAKFWIPDPTWLTRYGGWANVTVVPDGSLTQIPTIPRDGSVLREWSSAPVFVMQNGQKCRIHTPTILDQYTLDRRWGMVLVVPDGGLANIPQGPDAPTRVTLQTRPTAPLPSGGG